MRALTLWQPWAFAVVSGQKHVENRPWAPPAFMFGERIAIHAGKKYDVEGEAFLETHGVECGEYARCRVHGAIVGVATIVGVMRKDQHASDDGPRRDDPMFFGPYGWKLDDLRECKTPILDVKGMLGLWHLTPELAGRVYQECGLMENYP